MHQEPATTAAVTAESTFTSKYPHVVFEESDHEVVVVNLLAGIYFFLSESGAYVWMAIQSGQTINEIAQHLRNHAPESIDTVAEVMALVNELIELELIIHASQDTVRDVTVPDVNAFLTNGYSTPNLETYADLQDILLLDPVHDVAETGWPSTKP